LIPAARADTSVESRRRLEETARRERKGPKFLAGESYGTTRSAVPSQRLLNNDGI
jgi:carboxypeptidase C (cathepsin A)